MITFDPSIRPASRPAASTGLVKALHWNRRHLSAACTTKRVKRYLRDWYVLWIRSMGWLPDLKCTFTKCHQRISMGEYILIIASTNCSSEHLEKVKNIEGFQWKGHVAGERIEGAFHTEGVLSPLRSLDVFGISIHLSGEATWWLCWAPHHAGLRSCWLGCLQTLPVLAFFPTMHWGVVYGTILESIIAQKEECQVKYVTSCDPRRATMESHWNWLRLYLILLCRPVKSVASNLATPNYQNNKSKPSQDYILSSNRQLQSLYNLTKSLTKRKSPMQGLLSICPIPLEHRQLQEIIEIEIHPQETTRMSWGCKWWGFGVG